VATQLTWLDVPPRRRVAIPPRDLAIGVGLGVGLCVVAMVLAASMEPTPPPAPDEPLKVSIGVLATSDPGPGGGGGGGSRRAARAGARPSRPQAAAPSSPVSEPAQPQRASPSTSKVPAISVPSPQWDTPPGLPDLGELGDPVEGSVDGPAEGEGGDGTEGGTGGGEGAGGGSGTGDGGLGAYRSQLAGWLGAHFHVEGSGLDAKTLRKLRVRAVLELSEDRIVTDYSVQATGTPAVDDAARRALEAVKGQPVPAPPPSLGSLQRRINVTLTCRPDTCD
jgi:hypothetical protein